MSDTVTAALIAFGGVVIGYIFNMITDYIKNSKFSCHSQRVLCER